ncbi:DUF3800 domain-containing protein [Pseudomonas rhizosphaerae]|uniref:DUF3800 domain-containing protein n=1 Tax=Pseudomonas rhizosphaerae TaxID=216142 RepID=UPI001785E58B|nr:DUF3800 domain-containing protein [Pseudomonas rhizosphaerae]MBD8612194.1 DUF3800 domain-containing protein [Pseudomonas putida]MEB2869501.1 DUF3800 domain-containing protein [Pseudomonas rhizosphaerae]
MRHYVAYLDEFGHVGQYVARNHPKYKTHPAFGFAGLILPATEIREFAIYFYKLKCQLLAWDLSNENPRKLPAYQWEKKGSQLYALRNVTKYAQLRRATFRLLNHIEKIGGHVFYTGEHKTTSPAEHNSTETFKRQLLQAVRKIDRFCARHDATFMLMLDEQRAGNEWRETNVEICTLAMFEDASQKCRTLIEPPVQAESHLFQTIQCADWICGLIGRLMALSVAPEEYSELEPFDRYFSERIAKAALSCSGLEHQKTAQIPAEQAGEAIPDATGALAGDRRSPVQ